MTESKKLEIDIRSSNRGLINPKKSSYFVLSGNIHIYDKEVQKVN